MIPTEKIVNLAPRSQPTSVHQIADRLFPAYTVDDGRVYLAGCTLDNRLFLQVSLRHENESSRFFLDSDGKRVDAELAEKLGLNNTIELEKPPELAEAEIERLVQVALSMAQDQLGEEIAETDVDETAGGRPRFEVAAVWCKYASGKLRFTINDRSADLPFSDWAAMLTPPPYVCRYTNKQTFHLAATSDGRIVDAGQIETCEASGQRLLDVDLVTCSASGRRVSRELAEVCPVTDEHVLSDELVKCASCGEMVSPNSVRAGRCAACRNMKKLTKDDPRWERLSAAYPALARRRGWKISETASVYILIGSGIFKRIQLVVDKETLQTKRLAVGNRLSPAWRPVEAAKLDAMLQ